MSTWDGKIPDVEGALQESLLDIFNGAFSATDRDDFLAMIKSARSTAEVRMTAGFGVEITFTDGTVFELTIARPVPVEPGECTECPGYVGRCRACGRDRPFLHELYRIRLPTSSRPKHGPDVVPTRVPDLTKLGPPPARFSSRDAVVRALVACARCDAPIGRACVTTKGGDVGARLCYFHGVRVREATHLARAILATSNFKAPVLDSAVPPESV